MQQQTQGYIQSGFQTLYLRMYLTQPAIFCRPWHYTWCLGLRVLLVLCWLLSPRYSLKNNGSGVLVNAPLFNTHHLFILSYFNCLGFTNNFVGLVLPMSLRYSNIWIYYTQVQPESLSLWKELNSLPIIQYSPKLQYYISFK